ncbi:FliM/FliN family flagellar motor switch protein [Roseovarius faecimaris]|uniref:FliM/FliN family flagellar motor switch protein n=1 Tax=Roseovarius faecimaris TaxID=2494550 RepID=A0A6I6J119_9RHOB|nr:FliM/FliN family flagellar motor C-terminal domain-containing protein [Roseovarius faecimaris]QGX98478.1 FliM/FliN family flagellar motor switch protein [Roseovarius faecimaris]
MQQNDGLSIIHKKARVAREDFDARAMSPAKALRLAFAQAAEERLDMAFTVTMLEQTKVSTAALVEELSDDALLILLDGAEGARGAAILDTQVVAALIEMQVTGAVREGEARARLYTRTDAAMMAPLLDAGLAGADALLEAEQEGYAGGHFRFGDKVEDARVLSLALQGREFDLFRMTVSIGNGAKSGMLSLALPVRPVPSARATGGLSSPSRPASSLKTLAMEAPVTLNAVLSRMRRPLNEICALQPGMLLPVSPDAIAQAELVVRPRYLVAEGRLGQLGGMRAIRIRVKDEQAGHGAMPLARTTALSARGDEAGPLEEPALASLNALEPDPAFGGELPALGDLEGEADGLSLPGPDGLPGDLSMWEDDPDQDGQHGDSGEMALPDPLPMLDLP